MAKYYQDNKERLQKKCPEKYESLSEDYKVKRWQYGHKQHKNLSEHENEN